MTRRPTTIDAVLGPLPAQLTAAEADETCRICGRRRADHFGARATYCPDGEGCQTDATFVGSGQRRHAPLRDEARRTRAFLLNARKHGLHPIYRAIRGTRHGPGGPIHNAVLRFELVNERELVELYDKVLP